MTTVIQLNRTVRLWCEEGRHYWDRESKRGRRPASCPYHTPEKPEPSSTPEERRQRARATRERRKAQVTEADRTQMVVDLAWLAERIPQVETEYEQLLRDFSEAQTIDMIDHIGHRLDLKQGMFINLLNKRRYLQQQIFSVAS